jgi:Kyakuja-Dileera-Zisupton transposase
MLFFQRAPCENHFKAIEAAMMLSKACDVTGIVAIACARHGCFTPNGVANLFRGEQQKNVDWALVKACQTTTVDSRQGLLLIYDIACQYIIHLKERIGHLLPADLDVDSAIGLFHVHGHKDICFFRYATTFIPGAAVVAGEILESLWAVLNAVTPAMRTATLAHRAEIMDDHMTDSNHKKALGLTTWLCQRYTQAAAMSRSALLYYDKLTKGIDSETVKEWEAVISLAESERKQDRSVMDILGAAKPQSEEATALPEMDRAADGLVSEWLQLAIQLQEKQ